MTEYSELAKLADAKSNRLRLFMFIVSGAAFALFWSCQMIWYTVEYRYDSFGGVPLDSRPALSLDAGAVAAVGRNPAASLTVNPTVDQVLNVPTFAIAALVGCAVALVGFFFRSAAISLLSAVGFALSWFKLTSARWWFEQAPGRDGWVIERGPGQALFWLALMVSVCAALGGAYQSMVAYRADRRARASGGHEVEETAVDLLIRLVARTAVAAPKPTK
jgi:hypothetical protein